MKSLLVIIVNRGVVGELTLSIPWSDIRNKPLKISLKDVHITACLASEYDPEMEDIELQTLKQSKLKALEEKRQDGSYFGSLVSTLVDNVQISIRNIHIRLVEVLFILQDLFCRWRYP